MLAGKGGSGNSETHGLLGKSNLGLKIKIIKCGWTGELRMTLVAFSNSSEFSSVVSCANGCVQSK